MKYTKEVNDFTKALGLEKNQVDRLKNVIEKAYDQYWHRDGPNIDQIIAKVAPHIVTPEEAFWAATVIISDVTESLKGLTAVLTIASVLNQ